MKPLNVKNGEISERLYVRLCMVADLVVSPCRVNGKENPITSQSTKSTIPGTIIDYRCRQPIFPIPRYGPNCIGCKRSTWVGGGMQ